LALFDDVGDDEIAPVRRQFGNGGHDPEVGIAVGEVEKPELLLVEGEPIGIVAGIAAEEAGEARLLGQHLAAQLAVGEFLVADDVDLPDLRLGALLDLEDDIDSVLLELHDLGIDGSGEAALAAIELDDPRDVRARLGPGEDLARRQPDLRRDLVVLDPLVAFKDDAVDDRVLANLDETTPSLKPMPTSAKSSVAKRSFSASSPRSGE
jgi:hypothetical protein